MNTKKLIVGVLIILWVVGVAGVSAAAPPEPERISFPDMLDSLQVVSAWEQLDSSGFGDSKTLEVTALETFGGYLYAGTYHPLDLSKEIDGARIFRSSNGTSWTAVTPPGFGNSHDIAPPAILDFVVFKNRIYASTGRGNASQIWRSENGTIWAPMDVTGFSDKNNKAVTALGVYGGMIYAGVTNRDTGPQIWRSSSGDNNTWTKVFPSTPGSIPAAVTGFVEIWGELYAAVEYEADAALQIWRSFSGASGTWTLVTDGFTNSNNTMTGGMVVFGDELYVGGGNTSTGAQLWHTSDGDTWSPAITNAFGDSNNLKIEMVYVFENQLHVSTQNSVTGIEVWRWTNSTTWEQINSDGFGDANNTGSNWSNAAAAFQGQLYIGTSNTVDGGELWRMLQPYNLSLSPDATLAGAAGQTITYTLGITNTGTNADTFDLALSGYSWPTALSVPTIALDSGASGVFSVTVTIPSNALGSDTDLAAVTATSQGAPAKSASANLTTTIIPIYGLALSPDDALAGLPGGVVTYTLTITNNGNLDDTFNLGMAGNTWPTAVSKSTITLAPGASGVFSVTVSIPSNALANAADVATLTAASQASPGTTDAAQLTTTALPVYGLDLSPGTTSAGSPGTSVIYNLTVKNTGNITDTFNLSASGHSWPTTLSASQVTLNPSASRVFTVTVAIPAGTADQAVDQVTITAASQSDSSQTDAAVLETTSVAAPVYGVALSGDAALSGLPGAQVIYTLVVTNTGDVADSLNLSASGQTWTTSLSTSKVSLAPAASRVFTVTVSIPANALVSETEVVTLTAVSQADQNKTDSAQLTTAVLPEFGLDLSPADALAGLPGTAVTYYLAITNTGNLADIFDLALAGNSWEAAVSKSTMSLGPGASGIFSVTVSIPTNALANHTDIATLTAVSQGDAGKYRSAQLTTTALAFYGLDLSPGTASAGSPGTSVTYNLTVKNTGNIADIFDLSAAGQSWTTTLSTSQVALGPSASTTFTVTVTIPPGAADQAVDQVTITAASKGDTSKTDAAVLATTSIAMPVYGVALSGDAASSGPPGSQVIYNLAVTNTGDVADTITLSAAGQTWTTTLSASQVALGPSASTTFTVTVTIPSGAADQAVDQVTITAVSQGDSSQMDAAVLATTSVAMPVYGVALSGDSASSGPPGSQVRYTLVVTNTGNASDTYDLVLTGNSWTTKLSAQVVTLAAGGGRLVTITVLIPPEAVASASDQVSIQVTSRHDSSKHAAAALTTVSTGKIVKIYLPVVLRSSSQ